MQVSDSEAEKFSLTTDLQVSEVLEVYSFPTEVPEVQDSEVQVLEEDMEEDIATTTPNGTIMAQPLTLLMISTNTLSPNT
jgi:hypothetical protein